MDPTRREALAGLAALCAAGCATSEGADPPNRVLPPTADPDDFYARCIRCFRCGEVCTAGCIAFHPPWAGRRAGAPYIEPRLAACNVCMECTQVCPSGALTRIEDDDHDAILAEVRMGRAHVDHALCLSFQGRVCGECRDACPYPGVAIRLGPRAEPEVLDACVGCGRCEERCPAVPAAIRVFAEPRPEGRWTPPTVRDA